MNTRQRHSYFSSIRTRFALLTAFMLLAMLLTFYLGSRFILVHMVREAEKEIQVVGSDVKKVVYDNLAELGKQSQWMAGRLSAGGDARESLKDAFGLKTSSRIHLAAWVSGDGRQCVGYWRMPGGLIENLAVADLKSYVYPGTAIFLGASEGRPASGMIVFRGEPLCVAFSPVQASGKGPQQGGYLMLGGFLHQSELLSEFSSITRGISVTLPERQAKIVAAADAESAGRAKPAAGHSLFSVDRKYLAGGAWHLGGNLFSMEMPLNDLLGREIAAIAIQLPLSFSSVANEAMLWISIFICLLGIIFVIPVFWGQTRMLLDPLTKLSGQIQAIGETPDNAEAQKLVWPSRNEFGALAASVNAMLSALHAKTEAIRREGDRQRLLIASIPDCLCMMDNNGRVLEILKQSDDMPAVPGMAVGEVSAPPFFPSAECDALREAIRKAIQTDKAQTVLMNQRPKDEGLGGVPRHYEVRACRAGTDASLTLWRDVTEEQNALAGRKAFEAHLMSIEKLESLGNLAAGIAHDVNNILTIIQNTMAITWDSPTPVEAQAIRVIQQATEKGANLTRELMTYAGQNQTRFVADDPNSVIRGIDRLMSGVLPPNVDLELNLGTDLPRVDIDPRQFWKVIINLLKNASESIGGGSGNIRLSTYPFELTSENHSDFFAMHSLKTGPGVIYEIEDSGNGMSPTVLRRIFEPFFSTKSVGRGLGLATVLGIVDMHGGGIAITSEVGRGTKFRIWVPVSKQTEAAGPAGNATVPGSSVKNPCVLLVEDDPSILQSTQILLRLLHADFLSAQKKRDALDLFRKNANRINLVLLDAQLGQFDNVRLLAAFRQCKASVPVVIISGHNEQHVKQMFESQPYEGFLGKPYTREELAEVLKKFAR